MSTLLCTRARTLRIRDTSKVLFTLLSGSPFVWSSLSVQAKASFTLSARTLARTHPSCVRTLTHAHAARAHMTARAHAHAHIQCGLPAKTN